MAGISNRDAVRQGGRGRASFAAEYGKMVASWCAVFDRPLPDAERQAACLSLLCEYIDRMAQSAARRPNPTLQFYAYMLVLKEFLNPALAVDDFGHQVIWPAFRLVSDWVDVNRVARRPTILAGLDSQRT